MSLHFFTNEIIHLQAKHPEMNAARKPMMMAEVEMGVVVPCSARYSALGAKMCLKSRSASPRIGGITIRNENWASFCLLLPSRSPVAMVLPLLLKPGSTAHACAMPMMNACVFS